MAKDPAGPAATPARSSSTEARARPRPRRLEPTSRGASRSRPSGCRRARRGDRGRGGRDPADAGAVAGPARSRGARSSASIRRRTRVDRLAIRVSSDPGCVDDGAGPRLGGAPVQRTARSGARPRVAASPPRSTTTGRPRRPAPPRRTVYVAGDGERFDEGARDAVRRRDGSRRVGHPVADCSIAAAGRSATVGGGLPAVQRDSRPRLGRSARSWQARPVPAAAADDRDAPVLPLRHEPVADGSLWVVGDPVDRRICRVDETGGSIRDDHAPASRRDRIAADEGRGLGDRPAGGRRRAARRHDEPVTDGRSPSPGRPAASPPARAAVWVANALDGTVARIDPHRAGRRTIRDRRRARARSRSVRRRRLGDGGDAE